VTIEIASEPIPALDGFAIPEADSTELRVVVAVRRHWRLVATLTLVGGLGAYLLCQFLTPLYDSTVTVLIRPPEAPTVGDRQVMLPFMAPSEESIRKNEMAIIMSRDLAKEVIARLKLDQLAEFNFALSPPTKWTWLIAASKQTFERLQAAIGLTPSETDSALDTIGQRDRIVDHFLGRLLAKEAEASRVLQIRFRSEDPARAQLVANAVAERYTLRKQEQWLAGRKEEERSLAGDIERVNTKLRDSEHEIERIRNEKGSLPAANLRTLLDQASELNKQLVVAIGERAAAQGRLADLNAARTSQGIASAGGVLKSPLIERLQEEATKLSARIDESRAIYPNAEANPRVIGARNALKDLQMGLASESEKIASSARADFVGASIKETELRQAIASTKIEIAKATDADVDVRMYERKIDADKLLMTHLVATRAAMLGVMNHIDVASSVLSSATVARFPSYPPTLAVVAVALIIFATGGALAALMLERLDRSIWSTAQLRRMTSAPVLGALPRLGRSGGYSRPSPAAYVLADRRSMFAENLRTAWLQIDRPRQERTKTFLVTSSVSDEGKSSIAVSLARVLATSSRRTLLVDADLRYPTVHRALQLRPSPGLAEVLEKKLTLSDVIQVDKPSGAFVVAAGASVASPADLLQSDEMPALLAEMAAQFDAVIIDTPPVLAVPDAGILAGQVDTTVLVVRWGVTQMDMVVAALQRLQRFGGRLALILSMVDPKAYSPHGISGSDMFSAAVRKYYS
jgi:succinoglycan biosynthesis transport protein ExoP